MNSTVHTKYVYVIFYLDRDHFNTINTDLLSHGYTKHIKAIVPTVRILRKVMHGREVYEEVPLLFSYGFIRMPKVWAYSREFMAELRKVIPGIKSWVKSPENLHKKKTKMRIDNADVWDDFTQVALATRQDVKRFIKMGRDNNRFSMSDLLSIGIGDYIILKGYPYDGIEATVLDINQISKRVKLQLDLKGCNMEVELPFDQVLDTVYSNYESDISVSSQDFDLSNVTQEDIDFVLDKNQF